MKVFFSLALSLLSAEKENAGFWESVFLRYSDSSRSW